MIKRNFGCLMTGAILIVCFCSGCGKKGNSSQVVAKINDYVMTVADLKDEIQHSPRAADKLEDLEKALDLAVRKQVLIQEAQRQGLDRKKSFMKTIERYWRQTLIKELLKKLTGVVGIFVIGVMLFSGLSLSQAEEGKERKELQFVLGADEKCAKMTYLEFADILVGVLNIEMPAGTQRLSETELFEIQANMLAERGVTLFLDSEPDGLVTCGMVANVLYDALIGSTTESVEAKIEYLAGLGYLGSCAPSDILCASEIISTLNVPALSIAIAEGYSLPSGLARTEYLGIDLAPSNPAPESYIPKGAKPGSDIF